MGEAEKKITLAAACGFLFGSGATVASMGLPQAYPHWPVIVWQLLSWGGVATMVVSAIVGFYELAVRPRLKGRGNRVALSLMIVCLAGFVASGVWFLFDRRAPLAPPVDDIAQVRQSSSLDIFDADNPTVLNRNVLFKNNLGNGVFVIVTFDRPTMTSMVSFLVTGERPIFKIVADLADVASKLPAEISPRIAIAEQGRKPFLATETTFSGRVVIYHDALLSLQQQANLDRLYRRQHLTLELRDQKYMMARSVQ